MLKNIATLLLLGTLNLPCSAQTPAPALDFATAANMSAHCIAHARANGHGVAIAIFDQAGQLMHFIKMDGASPAAADLAQWKGKSAATYQVPTSETAQWNVATAPRLATAEGGLPLFTAQGQPLGGIGVSGAPSAFDAECGAGAAKANQLLTVRPGG